MPLLETDALTIRSTFDSLPNEAKPLASDWLRRYKDQQDEFGLPLFPSEVETQQADESAFVSMFDDVKQVDPGNGIYDQAERLKPGEGDRLRQREAGMRFLAKHYGDEEKIRRDFPLYRDDFAMKNGGKRDMGDGEFYSFVSQQVKRQQGQKLVRSRSLDAGFRAAIEGMGSLEKLAAVKSEAAANADNEVDAGAFLEAYGETQKVMSKHAAFIREYSGAIMANMDGGSINLEPLNERLLDMPGTERRMVIAALNLEAQKQGKKVKADKGEGYGKALSQMLQGAFMGASAEGGKFWQQTGEAAGRLARSAAIDQPRIEQLIASIPDTGEVMAPGEIKTAKDAQAYVRDARFRANVSDLAGGARPVDDSRITITLDETAQRLIQDAKEREMKRLRVADEIRSIGEAADPIPNVFASTIGTSGAALALMAGTRGLAAPALANAYTNIEFNDLSLKYPQMSTADKTQIAAISGAAQTALDYVGVKALDKLPGIKSLIAQPLTKQLAKRALARGALSYATENIVEAGQDAATPLLLALKQDVPGYDWRKELDEFLGQRVDVAIGLLPLTLLGIGAASVNEYRDAKNLLSYNDQLGAAGVVETDRVAVIEAAQSGDMGKAQSILMEAWGRRNPEVAAEYQDAMSQRQTDMSRATAELERLGAIPTLRRDGDGWTVTSNGTSTKFATWEEARDVATAAMGDMERAQTELVASVLDSLMASKFSLLQGENATLNTDSKGESFVDRVRLGAMTPEEAMEAAVAGGVIKGVTMQEARAIAAEVFGGQNASERAMQFRQDVEKIVVLGRNTVVNGESRSVINMAGNERAFLTAVEEVVEGRWKGGLQRRAFTKEQGVRWVQLAEAATGETFLEGATWEEIAASQQLAPRALTEAISRIVVADVLGRMKDGKRIGPGTVSRGLNLNDREQSALAAILQILRDYLLVLLERASKLAKARQEGKLGGEYDALFDALTGGSSQLEHDAGAAKEADAIASEAVDTSGYSPETPGPNGETFSMDRAGAGGSLHALSDRFYKGGQFMPPPDSLGSRKAKKELQKFETFKSPDMVAPLRNGDKWMARVIPMYSGEWAKRPVVFAKFDNESDAMDAVHEAQFQLNERLGISRAVPADASKVVQMPDGAQLVGPTTFSIRAYHGTPHKVDRFRTDKIGTGEGAQAYGYGLYFAEARKVAEEYRKTLSTTITVGGKQLLKNNQKITSTGDSYVDDLLIANDGDLEAAIASERAYADSMAAQGKQSRKTATGDPYETLNKLIALQQQQSVDAQTTGNLYTVELLPDESEFLDWDKPLSAQSEEVKAAIAELPEFPRDESMMASEAYRKFAAPNQASAFGGYDEQTAEFASRLLNNVGIPGIRYLDAGSRGTGDGTRNFVIFDENLVRILEENGKPVETFSLTVGKNLVTVHNLSESNLRHAIKVGGLAVPSLGVIRTDISNFDAFGEITLIARPDLIDPQRNTASKVFNADVYSPRYPTGKTVFKRSELDKVGPLFKGYFDELSNVVNKGWSWSVGNLVETLADEGFDRLQSNYLARYAYLRSAGLIEAPKSEVGDFEFGESLRKQTNDLRTEIVNFVREKVDQAGIQYEEKIPVGYTNAGKRKFFPHDLDTVVKIMTRKLKDGEGFNYGVPSIRAANAKPFKSIKAIQDSRDKIVTSEEMEALKKEVNEEFLRLAESALSARKTKPSFGGLDTVSDDMKALVQGDRSWIREMYGDSPVVDEMRTFVSKLRDMPTEYFEAKIRRAVQLQEFEAAVVPSGTNEDLKAALKKRGVAVREYDASDKSSRRAAIESASSEVGATFSIRPGDFSARMEAKFSLFQAKPELRLAIAQVAKERALRLGAEWIAKGDVIRSAKDIGKEARMREALAYEARMNEYLDGLTPNARQTLEFEPSALEDDPLVSAILDFGKLMSFTTAKKSGKVEAKSGDYDGQPWLPPAWFSKGAGIMPDQMAQAMFDAGLLPDAYTGTLWSELEKRIESTRKDKAAHREAVQAYKAAEKYARDASRAEADQWAENAKKQAGSPKAQRDMLKAALRTLDGILAAAPPEVRARVGGYVKLAGLATDEAMLQEIERRIDKLNVELEKWLKKQAVAEISKLFKKARPDMEAGKKGKGKDADMHALFAAAEAAADMDALAVAGRLADLDARITSGELTAEQEALAMTERGIVELVGDLKNADSGRAFSALDTLRDIYGGAWLKWKIAEIERKERRAGLRQDFIVATGKTGVRTERTKADKVNESLFGKGKAWLLNLSSMREVLAYAFGLDNERVISLVDAEREASNTYEDANQRLGDEIEELFTAMAGTRTKGERLRWNLSQRTIKTGKGELSQLEAIQALLMWRQEDGRRHMEGTRDENGKVTSAWSYDQAWIDEIEAALTPEARRVMSFIMGKYAAEWATLNPLYRARYGVNMPHHDAYAPITVTPMQTKAGEVVDPVTGSTVSSGSILTPGSLRTRSRNAIAEPDFRDALQTMILHSRQMEYWKAYYDLAVEMNAVLGNREVMNSVHAKGGKEAANALRQWIDVIAQGGFRDASLRLALFQAGAKLQGRAAGVALLGRMSAILSQSTQLAAAAIKMPVTSYLVRLAKLMTGGLGWRDAMRSDFIQRRFKTAPPIVRQALEWLASAKPDEIQQLSRLFGNVLSGSDAFFTSGTYAILLDYHREQGRAAGLTGAELETYAHTEAERATEQVAQPTRTANRSLAELSNTGPLGKIGWAFASEARQKVALAAHAALNAKNDPVTAAKSAFLTFAIGGLFTQVLKNLLREAKGDDDREMWSLGRLGYAMTIAPLASAIPFGSAIAGDSNMLSNIQRAIQTIGNDEVDFRDVDAILSAAGLFNDTAASLAQLSHLGLDLGKILSNAAD